jgi:hypothetical protein
MAATRPGWGAIDLSGVGVADAVTRGGRAATRTGSWRPDTPFLTSDGLKVTMRRAAGLTPDDVLRVPLRFQVPPTGDLRRAFRFNWATYDTLAGGQRARPQGPELLVDRLTADASTGVVVWDGAPDPERLLEELRWIAGMDQTEKQPPSPFRLVISQSAVWNDPVVNIVAALTAVEPTQRAGSLGTEYVSLTFKELPDQDDDGQRSSAKPKRSHKLVEGDTLHKLAVGHFHQASRWRNIAEANGITGVRASSASDLAAWAKKHHKTTLVFPKIYVTAVKTP